MINTECFAYFNLGNTEKVLERLQQLRASDIAIEQQTAGCEAFWHWLKGDREAAWQSFQRREQLVGNDGDFAYVLGNQAVLLGNLDRAMDWFELALEKRDQRIAFIRTDHREIAALIAHPRYQALLRKMNLDDESLREMGYL